MKRIPLKNMPEMFALVDDADYERLKDIVYLWKEGRVVRSETFRGHGTIYLHQDIIGSAEGLEIHHKDENPLNNQKDNLEMVTPARHLQLRGSKGLSKYMGVFLNTSSGAWRAKVKKNGKQYHCGSFDTEEEAARARDKKALELFGTDAVLNFPE